MGALIFWSRREICMGNQTGGYIILCCTLLFVLSSLTEHTAGISKLRGAFALIVGLSAFPHHVKEDKAPGA
jgi:hypothetical protein